MISLMFEVDENPPESFVIRLDAMTKLLDMSLVQEMQNFLPGKNFDKGDILFNRFFHNAKQFRIYFLTAVVDVV